MDFLKSEDQDFRRGLVIEVEKFREIWNVFDLFSGDVSSRYPHAHLIHITKLLLPRLHHLPQPPREGVLRLHMLPQQKVDQRLPPRVVPVRLEKAANRHALPLHKSRDVVLARLDGRRMRGSRPGVVLRDHVAVVGPHVLEVLEKWMEVVDI